jgi:hypothetical protein
MPVEALGEEQEPEASRDGPGDVGQYLAVKLVVAG